MFSQRGDRFECQKVMRQSERRELIAWLDENIGFRGRDWKLIGNDVWIRHEGHATLFALRWVV